MLAWNTRHSYLPNTNPNTKLLPSNEGRWGDRFGDERAHLARVHFVSGQYDHLLYVEQKELSIKTLAFPKFNDSKMNILEKLLKLQHPLENIKQTNATTNQKDTTNLHQLNTSNATVTRKEKRKAGQIKQKKLKQLKRQHEKITEAANKAKNTAYLLRKWTFPKCNNSGNRTLTHQATQATISLLYFTLLFLLNKTCNLNKLRIPPFTLFSPLFSQKKPPNKPKKQHKHTHEQHF